MAEYQLGDQTKCTNLRFNCSVQWKCDLGDECPFYKVLFTEELVMLFQVFLYILISYNANKKGSTRLPTWQPSLIFFNIALDSGSIIKPCTLKLFQVLYKLHKAGYWTIICINPSMRAILDAWATVPTFWRRHDQRDFLEWKWLNLDSNFMELYFKGLIHNVLILGPVQTMAWHGHRGWVSI